MNAQEAAQLCGMLKPRFAVPTCLPPPNWVNLNHHETLVRRIKLRTQTQSYTGWEVLHIHDTAHDAFMTLPAHTSSRENEV
jgi:hypothetical protein